jgi:hypothetical protein
MDDLQSEQLTYQRMDAGYKLDDQMLNIYKYLKLKIFIVCSITGWWDAGLSCLRAALNIFIAKGAL